MTAKLVFNAMLVELNNTNSPSLLLDDYNHFINKAIDIYINKRYANYDITQQTTDDLRVLKSTAILPVTQKVTTEGGALNDALDETGLSDLKDLIEKDKSFNAIYEVNLPSDYLHTLNCLCIYSVNKQYGCYDEGDAARYAAKRLTADSWSTIINDYYNRPTPKNPYYYIHNVNTSTTLPTNKYEATEGTLGNGTDIDGVFHVKASNDTTDNTEEKVNLARKINIASGKSGSLVEKTAGVRYGNASTVRMEIRYGQADVFELKGVMVDYIKAPQHIRLTKKQMDLTEDTSQIMEFPDYVCQEIINELVTLVMANNGDPRIQTVPLVSQSIADPVRQLTTSNARAPQAQA